MQRFLRLNKISKVDGILADLGVSSYQFDKAERGFSTRFDALLDMRMNQRQTLTASEILKTYSEEKLHKLFEQYGEVTNSKTLAKTVVQARNSVPLSTINEFKNAINPVIKGNPNKYLAQVFQALRIQVNQEFEALKEMLQQAPELLVSGGRMAVITFHSLEDRIVKNFFRNGSIGESEDDALYGTKKKSSLLVITKKPVTPREQEFKNNPRARSAKLRIAERI